MLADLSISDFVNDLDSGDKIHRITDVIHFLDMIKNRRMCFPSPSLWPDPFENFLLKANIELPSGEKLDLVPLQGNFYCQCWSLHEESDLLWRVYSPENLGVRISTTAEKLLWEVQRHYDLEKNEATYSKIGKVIYKLQEEVEELVQNEEQWKKLSTALNGDGFFEALLLKRKAFETEEEVRLIIWDFDNVNESGKLFFLEDVDLDSIIDNVTFDPRIDRTLFQAIKEFACNTGLRESKVQRSTLYESKQFSLKLRDAQQGAP
jgi:hypothetical protein